MFLLLPSNAWRQSGRQVASVAARRNFEGMRSGQSIVLRRRAAPRLSLASAFATNRLTLEWEVIWKGQSYRRVEVTLSLPHEKDLLLFYSLQATVRLVVMLRVFAAAGNRQSSQKSIFCLYLKIITWSTANWLCYNVTPKVLSLHRLNFFLFLSLKVGVFI